MDPRRTLIHMLQQLLKEMDYVQSQGAGYYTCSPFANRINKLVGQAQKLFPEATDLLATFDGINETDPNDPADKSKRLLEVRIETTQLIGLLECIGEDAPAQEGAES